MAGTRSTDLRENFPEGSETGRARDKVASLVGVSGRSVDDAEEAKRRLSTHQEGDVYGRENFPEAEYGRARDNQYSPKENLPEGSETGQARDKGEIFTSRKICLKLRMVKPETRVGKFAQPY